MQGTRKRTLTGDKSNHNAGQTEKGLNPASHAQWKKPKTSFARLVLPTGSSGILVMVHRGKGIQAKSESTNLFNEYIERLYLSAQPKKTASSGTSLEDEFHKEISEIQCQRQQYFKWIDLNVDCLLFCQTFDPVKPVELVDAIVRDLEISKQRKTRYTVRLIPVQTTCMAKTNDILDNLKQLINPIFHPNDIEPAQIRYAVLAKVRNNSKLDRMDLIHRIAALVGENHKVDLNNPMVTIHVQVINMVVGVSVLRNFYELKQFNIEALAK